MLLHKLIERRAKLIPEAAAFIFENERLSFGELNTRSNALALRLRELGVGPDKLVAVALDRTPDLPIALTAILKAGGAYIPLDVTFPENRLGMILEDARPALLLADESAPALPAFGGPRLSPVDYNTIHADESPDVPMSPENLAYVIFTSGSTGRPKGVQVTHKNAVNLLETMGDLIQPRPDDVMLGQTTVSFDIVLTELFLGLISGFAVSFLPTGDAMDGVVIQKRIRRDGVTIMQGTPAGWQLLFDSGFRGGRRFIAMTIGDTLPVELGRKLIEYSSEFFPLYGPTETTVYSAFANLKLEDIEGLDFIPLGEALPNQTVYIADENLHPPQTEEAGELLIGGIGVSRGYLGRPDLTAEKFIPDPHGPPGSRMYRTGDQVDFTGAGHLRFLGRIDNQVKIRGFRIELLDIEVALQTYPGLNRAIVMARDVRGERALVAYYTAREEIRVEKLRRYLSSRLPEYMAPSYYVKLDEFALTLNGKIDRKVLPDPEKFLSTLQSEYRAPRDELEERLAEEWAAQFKLERVGVEDNFFTLGGQSLLATRMVARLRKTIAPGLSVRHVFDSPTIAELAWQIRALEPAPKRQPSRKSGRRETDARLSFGQQRLWFIERLLAPGPAYNMSFCLEITGKLKLTAFSQACDELIKGNEALRTIIQDKAGEPYPRVLDYVGSYLELEEMSPGAGESSDEIIHSRARHEYGRTFELDTGPLFRLKLLRLNERRHIFLFTVHHIAFDDWSASIFWRRLGEHYETFRQGNSPPVADPAAYGYIDFAREQNETYGRPVTAEERTFWNTRLADLPPINFHPEIKRPEKLDFVGHKLEFILERELCANLRKFCDKNGITPFMALVAAYQILLYHYCGQEKFALGVPSAGRTTPESEDLIGFFVNNIILRVELDGNPDFKQVLSRVRESALDALEYQDVPFEKIVEALNPPRESNRNPIFQVVMAFQEEGLDEVPRLEQTEVRPFKVDNHRARLDLEMQLNESGEVIEGELIYNISLFDPEKAKGMPAMFLEILRRGLENPELRLRALWNQARHVDSLTPGAPEYTGPLFLETFAETVRRYPEHIAVSYHDEELTYLELDRRSDQIATRLKESGARPEIPVGLCLERSHLAVLGFLAILKVGAVYLPLEVSLPADRINYLMEDTGVTLALVDEAGRLKLSGRKIELLEIREILDETPITGAASPVIYPENIAYIMYTSGTGGRPKGVQVSHRSMAGFLESQGKVMGITQDDRLLSFISLNFDVSISEFLLGLGVGARIIMESGERLRPGPELLELIRAKEATVAHLPAAVLGALPREDLPDVRIMVTGGEECPAEAITFWSEGRRFFNAYGPTETTIAATILAVERVNGRVSLGKPLEDCAVYILDENLKPVGEGEQGEIYIGGSAVARGYLSRPALTAERFLPDPGAEGKRMYRTGDLGRRLKNGEIDFLGRVDRQLKVRGYRVEPEEIESVLVSLEGVVDAAILARETAAGENQLMAFLIDADKDTGETRRAEEIKAELKKNLPAYMIPPFIYFLERFPVTSNSKIDYAALLEQAGERVGGEPAVQNQDDSLEHSITNIWRELLGLKEIGPGENFFDIGGHSLLMVRAQARLKDIFKEQANYELTVTDLFQYSSVNALLEFLRGKMNPERTAPRETSGPHRAWPGAEKRESVVIVGMAGRFPGAANLEEYWRNLIDGVDSISRFSREELSGTVADEILERSDYVRAAGVVEGAELFDAEFFGFTPREAQLMDPQQRLFLEQSYLALENAGYVPRDIPGKVGVFGGGGLNDYALQNLVENWTPGFTEPQFHVAPGNGPDFLTTRVSYALNLKGPSMVIQTACSTGLVALQTACRSLLFGDSDIALAGGVNIFTPLKAGYRYEEGGIYSPDGVCRPFDANARGTVNGSGVGIVVLKRLSDALRDGDTIQARVLGLGMNNDGSRKAGYTAPGVAGQVEAIREALAESEVPAETIGYIETHGTGTALGDPIELKALQEAFGLNGKRESGSIALGSVKSNIGHLSVAAGIAGLIKTVLALRARKIPPNPHFNRPNPGFDFDQSPFYVNTAPRDWRSTRHPLRAGVSSFGIGGTNVHAILEEAELREAKESAYPWHLLVLSARSPTALSHRVRDLREFLQKNQTTPLADVAYTSQVGRERFRYRTTVACRNRAEAIRRLEAKQPVGGSGARGDEGNITLLFPGQGPQYPGMGRELYENEPVFKATADHCFDELNDRTGIDLRELIYGKSGEIEARISALNYSQNAQPALFIMGYSLARLLLSRGYVIEALFGQSLGEYAAACLAGVFSTGDALELLAVRGRLMEERTAGVTIAVFAKTHELPEYTSYELDLAIDAPGALILSGVGAGIEAYERRLAERGLIWRKLNLAIAPHSRLQDAIQEDYARLLAGVTFKAPLIPMISNVTGDWAQAAEIQTPGYWLEHSRRTVRLTEGFETLLRKNRVCAEAGPGRGLCSYLKNVAGERTDAVAWPLLRSRGETQKTLIEVGDQEYFTAALGKLWEAGVLFDPEKFYPDERRYRVEIPGYPFERKYHWIQTRRRVLQGESRTPPAPGLPVTRSSQASQENQITPESLTARVTALWVSVLGIDRIRPEESFFSLGGDSLLAVHLSSRLRETFQVNLSVKDFIENPTIHTQVEYLKSQNVAIGSSSRQNRNESGGYSIRLREGSGDRTIFFMPPAGGSSLCYMGLAERLAPGYTAYGFESPGLHDDRPVLRRIEEMAELYMREVRAIEPLGPYYLAGWSGGGVIAFEMARRLKAEGAEVKFLGLIDAGLELPGGENMDLLRLLQAFISWLSFVIDVKAPTSYEDLKMFGQWVGVNLPVSFQEIFERDLSSIIDYFLNLLKEIPRFVPVFKANFMAVLAYRPQIYEGAAVLFRTGMSSPPGRDRAAEEEDEILRGLRKYIKGGLDRYHVQGNHLTLLDSRHVESLAAEFNDSLARPAENPFTGDDNQAITSR